MQVHAIYENGRVMFQQPIRLKSRRIEVDIIIPDNCIDNELQVEQKNDEELHCPHGADSPLADYNQGLAQDGTVPRVSPTRERLDAILGPWRSHGGLSGKDDYKVIWHEHLEEKYLAKR